MYVFFKFIHDASLQKKQITEKNEQQGKKLLLKAANMRAQPALLFLVNVYARGRHDYPLDIGKAQCWFSLAQQADTGKTISMRGYLNRWMRMAKEKGATDNIKYNYEQGCELSVTTSTKTDKGEKYGN